MADGVRPNRVFWVRIASAGSSAAHRVATAVESPPARRRSGFPVRNQSWGDCNKCQIRRKVSRNLFSKPRLQALRWAGWSERVAAQFSNCGATKHAEFDNDASVARGQRSEGEEEKGGVGGGRDCAAASASEPISTGSRTQPRGLKASTRWRSRLRKRPASLLRNPLRTCN